MDQKLYRNKVTMDIVTIPDECFRYLNKEDFEPYIEREVKTPSEFKTVKKDEQSKG